MDLSKAHLPATVSLVMGLPDEYEVIKPVFVPGSRPDSSMRNSTSGQLRWLDLKATTDPTMIVSCTSPDHEGWLALRRNLFPHRSAEYLLAEMKTFCADPNRFAQFLSLSEGSTAVGLIEVSLRTDYVNGTSSSPVAYLESIFTVPSARRQGIARAMVADAEIWARRQGCREFASDALLHNVASHAMHGALGFQESQRVVFFRKALDQV